MPKEVAPKEAVLEVVERFISGVDLPPAAADNPALGLRTALDKLGLFDPEAEAGVA